MVNRLIEFAKNKRKQSYLNTVYTKKFAFIGIGHHSINNLYPVLNFLRVDIKYIVTKGVRNSKLIDKNFNGVIGTNDLDMVLADSEIAGVFICTNPSAHFELIKKVLKAGKAVFVEKPPCANLSELEILIDLERKTNQFGLVGLQKQYAPNYQILKNKKLENTTYNYRFVTGAYPDGDPLTELFIHPLSLLTYLFGTVKKTTIITSNRKYNTTIFLNIMHDKNNIGSLELSTDYSWENATETLIVNSKNEIFESANMETLYSKNKNGTIFRLPKEKIFKSKSQSTASYMRNSFSASLENNQLFSSGYYSQIKCFVDLVEKGNGKNQTTFKSCIDAYKIIEKINGVPDG